MEPTYNWIGANYNATRRADPGIRDRLASLLELTSGNWCLDIGCGTGSYTIALAELGLRLKGVDPSERMLTRARIEAPSMDWSLGSAERIPAGDETFDGAVATLTVHHWSNLMQAFSELYRVLKPAGRVVIFTATPK